MKGAIAFALLLSGCATAQQPSCRYEAIGGIPGYILMLDKDTGAMGFVPAPPTPTPTTPEHRPEI